MAIKYQILTIKDRGCFQLFPIIILNSLHTQFEYNYVFGIKF